MLREMILVLQSVLVPQESVLVLQELVLVLKEWIRVPLPQSASARKFSAPIGADDFARLVPLARRARSGSVTTTTRIDACAAWMD